MRAAAGLSAVILAALAAMPAPAQPEPKAGGEAPGGAKLAPGFEQRVYDLSTFVERVADYPGPMIDLRPPAAAHGGIAGAAFTLEEPLQAGGSPDILVSLIQANIAEDTWSDKRTSIQVLGEELIVIQRPEVHAKIAQMVAYLRRETELQITVEGKVVLLENALLDELRAGAPGPVALTDAAAKGLAEALARGERATLVRSLRATARNGQRVHFAAISQQAYVEDYDVEVTTGTVAADPIIGYLLLGAVLDVRPTYARGSLACEVRFTHQTGPQPIPTFETGVPGMGPIHLPETAISNVETTVSAKDGQTLLAGRIGLADPKDPASASKSLCFFVRPALVPIEAVPAPASEERRQMRLFDVGVLTGVLRDFPGPSLSLVPDQGVAISAAEETREVFSSQALLEAIRHNIAPESWENARNTIDFQNRLLYVRQTPDVLDAIKRYLDDLMSRRWRMISTRAEVLAADAAGYPALLAKYPSLAAGVMKLDAAEVAEILARAAKGDGLSLAASAELAGMNRQRVHVQRHNCFAYVRDYDIELATLVAVADPQVDLANDGVILAAAGCTTTDSDARLAAVESELKALRAELAELKAQAARPAPPPGAVGEGQAAALAGFPGTTVDPEMLEKLRILSVIPNVGDDRALKDLQERVGKLGELAKTVEALQGDVAKLKEGPKGR